MTQAQLPRTSPESFEARRARLRDAWRKSEASQSFVLSAGWARPRNFAHNVFPFRAESHFLFLVGEHIEGALLAFRDDEYTLCLPDIDEEASLWDGPATTPGQWRERLGLATSDLDFVRDWEDAAVLPPQDEETAGFLSGLLGRNVEAQSGPHLSGSDGRLADAMVGVRLVHDEAALAQLRAAAEKTARAHRAGMAATLGSTFETQVRGAMEGSLVAQGLFPGYTSIVTTHGEILHAPRSDGLLHPGDLLLCDVGGETREGFTGDITRTWPVSGRFSATQRQLYELVLDVQTEAIAAVRPGMSYVDLHLGAVRKTAEHLRTLGILRGSVDALVETGAASVFLPHGLGHLLGLDVHDMEDLGDRAGYGSEGQRSEHPSLAALRLCRILRKGMCVTIEPGFYQVGRLLESARKDEKIAPLVDWETLSRFSDVRGIRIEDDVLVTEQASEVLTADAPKLPDAIEEAILEASH